MGKLNILRNNYKTEKHISAHPAIWGSSRVWNNSHCHCVWLASDVICQICSQRTKYCGYTTVRGYGFVNASQFWFATLLFFLPNITSLKGFMMSKMTGVSPQTPRSWWPSSVSRWLTGEPELDKLALLTGDKLRRGPASTLTPARPLCLHQTPPTSSNREEGRGFWISCPLKWVRTCYTPLYSFIYCPVCHIQCSYLH